MTEEEWLQSEDFDAVIGPLRGVPSRRKWRLFALACVRRIWHLVPDRFRPALEFSDRFVEGKATQQSWADAWVPYQASFRHAELAACWASCPSGDICARAQGNIPCEAAMALAVAEEQDYRASMKEFADYLREIFGNPFGKSGFKPTWLYWGGTMAYKQPAPDPGWLGWNGGTVEKLARGIAEERAFEQMPILGDALEDAGCSDAAILEHCRRPGRHLHGCWVVDLLTGKS
jgi:hypothetical protein